MSSRSGDFIKGLLMGGLVGAIAGILYAPKSGKETREDIGKRAEEIMAKAKRECERALEKSKNAYEAVIGRAKEMQLSAKEKVEEIGTKANELAERGKESFQDSKGRLEEGD